MTHPYLIDPERAAAFAYLTANPTGSRSRWAAGCGWSPSKVQRFIEALVRFRLAEIEVIPGYFSLFKPLVDPPISARSETGQKPVRNRSEAGPPHLEASRSRSSVPRCGKAPEKNGGNAEAMTCIATVNEVLGSNFPSYEPIRPDNYGSHRAVQTWLNAGMSLSDMQRMLRQKAAAFNPSRSGGDLPRSLGYFTRWMLHEWAIEKRQLPLPLMTVDRTPAQRERMEKPVSIGDLLPKVERG